METLFKDSYNEIVFEKRNRDFGAYLLRKKYPKSVLVAYFFSILLFSIALASPIILSYFQQEEEIETTQQVVAEMINVEEITQPKEEIKKIEAPKESIKFPPLEIQPDNLVKEEDIATEDELKESNPGSETVEGEKGHSSEDASTAAEPEKPKEPVEIKDNNVYDWVDQAPEYPGGKAEMIKYIYSKIVYPQEARDKNIQGKVYITFVVNIDGKPSDFKITKSSGNQLLDDAAMSAVKTLNQHFKPGSLNGELKRCVERVPISFILK